MLYVGKAGSMRGPVPVTERLRRHAREKSWWLPGIWVDVTELPGYAEVMAEERAQILALRPVHNVNFARCRAAGHEMDGNGRCTPCRDQYNATHRDPHWAAEHPDNVRDAQARAKEKLGVEEYNRRHAQWSGLSKTRRRPAAATARHARSARCASRGRPGGDAAGSATSTQRCRPVPFGVPDWEVTEANGGRAEAEKSLTWPGGSGG